MPALERRDNLQYFIFLLPRAILLILCYKRKRKYWSNDCHYLTIFFSSFLTKHFRYNICLAPKSNFAFSLSSAETEVLVKWLSLFDKFSTLFFTSHFCYNMSCSQEQFCFFFVISGNGSIGRMTVTIWRVFSLHFLLKVS